MIDQFEFGFPRLHPPAPAHRMSGSNLFMALRPDDAAVAQARAIARDIRAMYRIDRQPLGADRLHVSLLNLGRGLRLDERTVAIARQVLAEIRFAPFEMVFDHVASFRSGTAFPVVLSQRQPSLQARQLAGRLGEALVAMGVNLRYRPNFQPHMTLIYHHAAIDTGPLEVPVAWQVDRTWLIHSMIGQTRYEFLWPMPGWGDRQALAERRSSAA